MDDIITWHCSPFHATQGKECDLALSEGCCTFSDPTKCFTVLRPLFIPGHLHTLLIIVWQEALIIIYMEPHQSLIQASSNFLPFTLIQILSFWFLVFYLFCFILNLYWRLPEFIFQPLRTFLPPNTIRLYIVYFFQELWLVFIIWHFFPGISSARLSEYVLFVFSQQPEFYY